jgi:hypothetical protein
MKKHFAHILFVNVLTLLSIAIEAKDFLKIEVQCPQSFKSLKISALCPKKPCSWQIKTQSKTASVWVRGSKEIEVIEVPNQSLVRLKYFRGKKSFPLPWCSMKGSYSWESLNQKDLSSLKAKGGTLYFLSEESPHSAGTINMLKGIDHPCRQLVTVKSKESTKLSWYYLKPLKKNACQ